MSPNPASATRSGPPGSVRYRAAMTFSIVARLGDAFGVAVASKFLAVGNTVPAAQLGVGAVATQSFAKVSFKADGLALLSGGASAQQTVDRLTAADELRATRQLGVVGPADAATYTGTECLDWAGGRSGGDADSSYAIQGNILVGPQVVEEMERAWLAGVGQRLDQRLLAALLAGDAAGGDRRGRQGAALFAVAPGAGYDGCGVLADLRVDDHPQAATELARLADLSDLYFSGPQDVQPWTPTLREEVAARLATLGYAGPDLAAALDEWAGVENYEMRLTNAGMDARVLAILRESTGG